MPHKRQLSKVLSDISVNRASKQFVYTKDGKEFLDCISHTAHVGHSHPAVSAAASTQFSQLVCATGFLNHENSKYIKELVETFPHELSVCFLVNSESEANDLALRLARFHTNNEDVLVMDGSYHGHCGTLMEISPSVTQTLKDFVHVLPLPYDDKHDYIQTANNTIKSILLNGRQIACFITELVCQNSGMVFLPYNYLKEIFRLVHSVEGLCIVNESLTGLGRSGESLWGFQAYGVHPDIVTVGKIIGNGYPMAAVLTTPIIAASLQEYRNTYGGNPVSCAIGNAVLNVVRNEKLVSSSKCVGMYLMNGLRDLQKQHQMIKEVRGMGLCLGIELTSESETPDKLTSELVEGLKSHCILVGQCGEQNNVLSINPPLCFTMEDGKTLLSTMKKLLHELDTHKCILETREYPGGDCDEFQPPEKKSKALSSLCFIKE